MLPALVLGDTSTVTAQTTEEFRTAGLTHLTAVSGANVTIVCGAVLMTAALLGPRMAVALAALALVAFVIVVQPSASVLRAAVMGAITLLAVVSHRRRQAIPVSASVIMLMIAAPELAVDVGLALSVSATARVGAPRVWSRRLVGRRWPKPLADGECRGRSAARHRPAGRRDIRHLQLGIGCRQSCGGRRDPVDHGRRHGGRRAVSAVAVGRATADPVYRPGVAAAAACGQVGRGRCGCFGWRSVGVCSAWCVSPPPLLRCWRGGGGGFGSRRPQRLCACWRGRCRGLSCGHDTIVG